MQQVFGPHPCAVVGDEQPQQPVGQPVAEHDQATSEAQIDHQPSAQDRPDALQAPGANRLGAEDRRGDGNRQRRELHIVDDLRHRAIGRRGLGTVTIDQGQDDQLRQRQHHHLQARRQADAQDFAEDDAVQAQGGKQLAVWRHHVVFVAQAQDQKQHRQGVTHQPGIHRTLDAHGRQADPAANQRRRQQQAHQGGDHQRQERRNRVADPTQQLGIEDEHQQQRHDQHHHLGVAHRIVEHVHRRAQRLQRRARKQAAQHGGHQAHQRAQGQGGTGDRLDQPGLLGAPCLADQYRGARPQADHQSDKEKHDGKHPRHRSQRLGAEHLANVNAVEGTGKALQEIGQHHRCQEQQVDLPQGALPSNVHEGLSPLIIGLGRHCATARPGRCARPSASARYCSRSRLCPGQTAHARRLQSPADYRQSRS